MSEFLITAVLEDARDEWGDTFSTKLRCPVCTYNYQHANEPHRVAEDDYQSGWSGRGDLLIVPIEGECGHKWEICFGFHKGQTILFARLTHRAA